MVKLVDTVDLGSTEEILGGSNPFICIGFIKLKLNKFLFSFSVTP